ncbi:MAG: hypothetical protein EBZ95_11055 [Chitinophagia bacterium]|nr:hypothetical protein [Chitinophagia bacterium]
MSQLNNSIEKNIDFYSYELENVEEIKNLSAKLTGLIQEILNLHQSDQLKYESLQDLLEVIIQVYGQKYDDGQRFPMIAPDSDINATTALVAASSLLKMKNIEIFELGMWQSWSGSR